MHFAIMLHEVNEWLQSWQILIFIDFLIIGVQIVQYKFDNETAHIVDFLFFIYCHTALLVLKREYNVGIITVWVRVVVPEATISLSLSLSLRPTQLQL